MSPESSSMVARGYRFQASLPAVLFDEGQEYGCRAYDLSRTGVLLIGELPSPSGEEVELSIRSVAGDVEQRFVGRVARREPACEDIPVRLAVEFLTLDLDQKQNLEVLLARVMEGMAPAPFEALRPGAPPHEVRKAIESVPLAHRITLAARGGPRDREFLRLDPHPLVLEALARNPNLLQAEARALASVAQLLPSTLEILGADPRWSEDEELHVLVATHPQVPFPLAERLIAGSGAPALKKMLGRPSLKAVLRDKIVKRLAHR